MSKRDYQKQYREDYAKKHKRISITVDQNEYSALEHIARKEGIKVTSLVKHYAFAGLGQSLAVPKEIEQELKELRFLIRNIANNVNQAAHHSNTIKQLVDENGLLEHIRQLEKSVKDYTEGRLRS